jgi:hypothetical protein
MPRVVGKEDMEIGCEGLSPTDQGMMVLEGEFSDSSRRSLDIYTRDGKFLFLQVFE